MSDTMRTRLLAVLGVLAVILLLYLIWARPMQLRTGATEEEVQRAMPGDELNPAPTFLATRAITIQGTPEEIWPWLIQMGYGRAGLYGFDMFENVGGPSGRRSAERVVPQWQDFKVGDPVRTSPMATMHFYAIRAPDHLVWASEDETAALTWALYPVDREHTRLVSRIRWSHHWAQPNVLAVDLLAEFTDHLAVRKILQGIQGRVEGQIPAASDATIELFIYLGTLLTFLWAITSVLRLPLTLGSWLVGVSGGVTWLISWYGPVSIWTGPVLALLVVWAVRFEFQDLERHKAPEPARARRVPSRKR